MDKAMVVRIIVGIAIGAGLGALMGHFGQCTTGACPLTANPWRGAVYGAFLGFMFAYSMGGSAKAREAAEAAERAEIAGNSPVVYIQDEADFQKRILQGDRPALVDFYSNSCGPCRMLAPTIHTLAERYRDKALVAKVNLDVPENRVLAGRFGIRSIPTVIFFDKGKEIERLSGYRREKSYTSVMDALLQPEPADSPPDSGKTAG